VSCKVLIKYTVFNIARMVSGSAVFANTIATYKANKNLPIYHLESSYTYCCQRFWTSKLIDTTMICLLSVGNLISICYLFVDLEKHWNSEKSDLKEPL